MEDFKSKKILFIFGTRPEAIKMAPVIKAFQKESYFETRICITAQHREMLDQVLYFFEIQPDYDLDLMQRNQDLTTLTSRALVALKVPFEDYNPDLVLVHGDTTTTMTASLAAFYAGIKVGHVEAGLRTFNLQSPFPEELNRQFTSKIADFHFAPTQQAQANLVAENILEEKIVITGNTVIDALQETVVKIKNLKPSFAAGIPFESKKVILVTGHRRENFGDGMQRVCNVVKEIALAREEVHLVYPVHLNPNVQTVVEKTLGGVSNISLIAPLEYPDFVWLLNESYFIITDSGGVQEEAPSLGKPVIVTRDTTERPEAVNAGTVKLVGTNAEQLKTEVLDLIDNAEAYKIMSSAHNPYGDGKAAQRIVNFVKDRL
ncbi:MULTISPECIES: non-hydrolyzing UDP-N-acetylglucosamine 2-epimerase [Leeuwenhoekiella]|uniref:non-hydrolyzing UDP-N-acetylglucosamine 2-epimerase n=1 Tax=Leeuwenhoekiella TaxID=283735 RepID=UPI000C4CAE4F|nr:MULTISPECIES: UDP-N-acetylglucosamine 2-epimerase (non-hydrolyzing) [Leeuwenhoekiella]MAO44407.1 UDP-N-acetylglucosamine 2-epimerase (non-hydrolyzing) [Leeuwenhoekiella sp.]|tara:strand:+ start:2354 stop:3478 length:1125 start_codon:yes stop_codon:yes gene_type:complete